MNRNELPLRRLAARVDEGDPSALPALEAELARHMARIVRRALRAGPPGRLGSTLSSRIRAEAARLEDSRTGEPDRLVGRVADDLRASVIGRLRAGCPSVRAFVDTIRA